MDTMKITAERVSEITVATVLCFLGYAFYNVLGPVGLFLVPAAWFLFGLADILRINLLWVFVALASLCLMTEELFMVPIPVEWKAVVTALVAYSMLSGWLLFQAMTTHPMVRDKADVRKEIAYKASLYGWDEVQRINEYTFALYGKNSDQLGAEYAEYKMKYLQVNMAMLLLVNGFLVDGMAGAGIAIVMAASYFMPFPKFALPTWLFDIRWSAFGGSFFIGAVVVMCHGLAQIPMAIDWSFAGYAVVAVAVGNFLAALHKSSIYSNYGSYTPLEPMTFSDYLGRFTRQ